MKLLSIILIGAASFALVATAIIVASVYVTQKRKTGSSSTGKKL
jgi:hypothetical protein